MWGGISISIVLVSVGLALLAQLKTINKCIHSIHNESKKHIFNYGTLIYKTARLKPHPLTIPGEVVLQLVQKVQETHLQELLIAWDLWSLRQVL